MPKLQHIPNRLQDQLSPEPELPKNYEERKDAFTNAVFAAVAFLQTRLRSSDQDKAMEAAMAILELEKTRLRHGRGVSGTNTPCDAPMKPIGYSEPPVDEEDDFADVRLDDDDEDDNDEDEIEEVVPVRAAPRKTQPAVLKTPQPEPEYPPDFFEKLEVAFELYGQERIKTERALQELSAQEMAQGFCVVPKREAMVDRGSQCDGPGPTVTASRDAIPSHSPPIVT